MFHRSILVSSFLLVAIFMAPACVTVPSERVEICTTVKNIEVKQELLFGYFSISEPSVYVIMEDGRELKYGVAWSVERAVAEVKRNLPLGSEYCTMKYMPVKRSK